MKTRLAAWPMAVAVRYATRRFLRRVITSAEVADNWLSIAVAAVMIAGMNGSIVFLALTVLNLAAAFRHSRNLDKLEKGE